MPCSATNSLSRLGDSLKFKDSSTTGKFGRGFNSVGFPSKWMPFKESWLIVQVYNWTDSPSIVSRERLLILDPHLEWSKGGPVYDFVANSREVAMQNHMATFQIVMEHLDRHLEGTVIRIPLRTEAQATKSEISDRGTTVSDVLDILQSLVSKFGNNGLLFMRNVEKLEIGSVAMAIRIEMENGETLQS
jgi:sacsin